MSSTSAGKAVGSVAVVGVLAAGLLLPKTRPPSSQQRGPVPSR